MKCFKRNWPIVEIYWSDHTVESRATKRKKLGVVGEIRSSGYLTKKTKEYYVVSQEIHDDGKFRENTTILRGVATSIKYLNKHRLK